MSKICKKSDKSCPYHACMSNHCQYNEVKVNTSNGKPEWVRHCKVATYVLMISRQFPATHPKKGQSTFFLSKIAAKEKIHTIRSNYELWKNRIDKVNEGRAVIELRFWDGKPYASKQQTFKTLKQGEVGIQKLDLTLLGWFVDDIESDISHAILANNDGLNQHDFLHWFKGRLNYNMDPLAIIHFTKFRY